MKKNIAKAVWVMIVIISIILIVFAVFMNIFKMSAYYSYPRAEANVLEVRNYERRSDGQDTKYGSSVHVEYSVLGEKVNSWMTYDRYSTLERGDIITVAYNPDNPSYCREINEKIDITQLSALVATIIFIAWMCKKTFASHKDKALN